MIIAGHKVGDYVVRDVGGKRTLIFDTRRSFYSPSIADDKFARFHVLKVLQQVEADRIVLADVYERVYEETQTKMLVEMANLIQRFKVESVWSYNHLGKSAKECEQFFPIRHQALVRIAGEIINYDPILAYLTLLQEVRKEQEKIRQGDQVYVECTEPYLANLVKLKARFDQTELIKQAKKLLNDLAEIPETKMIYKGIFEAEIKPSFIGSKLSFSGMEKLELVDEYSVGESNVQIFSNPDKVEKTYFVNPPEYSLIPDQYFVLSKTREIVASYKPGQTSLSTVARSRRYFERLYESTIKEVAQFHHVNISPQEMEDLGKVVARYTVGYGILELLLNDRRITDIYIDSPIGSKPIYIVHSDYGQCQTNISFTENEANALISKMRAMSGRPFDEAHPVMDFDLADKETRVAVIGPPLAPEGSAFAFRLHKITPWTLEQFIDNDYLNALAAGLLSFFIDMQTTTLVAGSRGSGKTSLLGSLLLEIPQNSRILIQEDSVTGDSKILVERNGALEYLTVGELIDSQIKKSVSYELNGLELCENKENIKVFSIGKNGNVSLSKVSQMSRHKVNKQMFEIKTRTGRKIKVTKDHSLFGWSETELFESIKPTELKKGDKIVVPRRFEWPEQHLEKINLLDYFDKGYVVGEEIKEFIEQNKNEIFSIIGKNRKTNNFVNASVRNKVLKLSIFKKLFEKSIIKPKNFSFKIDKTSKPIPYQITLDENTLEFFGLWLVDGCYDSKYGVIVSAGETECLKCIHSFSEKIGLIPRLHSDGFSTIISNTTLVELMKKIGFNGNSYTKKIPSFCFNLSKQQMASLLRGIFTGDGHASKKELLISLCSEELVKQLQTILLFFEITMKISERRKSDKTIPCYIGHYKNILPFNESIGFLQEHKQKRLNKLILHNPKQDIRDTIPLSSFYKEKLSNFKSFNNNDYVVRGNSLGREKLKQILQQEQFSETQFYEKLYSLAFGDIYWDEITEIKPLGQKPIFVYDFSVPGKENFVCENILAHNTLELPVPYMKNIGFNIQRMKTRSPISISKTETEVDPAEALRTALRLGDSALVLGEVRSKEAKVLYEAMRVGAAGNVVLGTIHADSAYAVWDRVVNDLGVPTTSFKATDLVVVARPIRFKGSARRHRRVVEITEVKKHWNKDPEEEGGLLSLMSYDAGKDTLELQEDNLKESDLFKKIQKTSGLGVNDIWDDIRCRGNAKLFLVELKNEHNLPLILEADNTTLCSNKLLLMKEKQIEESGKIDFDKLLVEWKEWVTKNILPKVKTKTIDDKAKKDLEE
jgi:type IV secretory pathway ATPase VirB11/archaellum biosynthesis ATPase/intein/homing endonuclease